MIFESGVFSLSIQFLVGIIDIIGLTFPVEYRDELLRDLLKLEIGVQAVEFIFYAWLIFSLHATSRNITPYRYLDWFITTPLMLVTLIGFLSHRPEAPLRLPEFLEKERTSILGVVVLNALMLALGLAGEFQLLSNSFAVLLGFLPFAAYFYHIYKEYLSKDPTAEKKFVYSWFLGTWGLYGIFALFGYRTKNVGYNILDLFSKNLFGVFLAYFIWKRSRIVKEKSPSPN